MVFTFSPVHHISKMKFPIFKMFARLVGVGCWMCVLVSAGHWIVVVFVFATNMLMSVLNIGPLYTCYLKYSIQSSA